MAYAFRQFSTTASNRAFDEATKWRVFSKGRVAEGLSPQLFRLDACGALIEYARYGQTTDEGTGWEIDHIHPVSRGGGDNLENLQPLQWQNNRAKGDNPVHLPYCKISRRR